MKLHHEGKTSILIAVSILLIISVTTIYIPVTPFIRIIIVVPFLVLTFLVLWFFRIPNRQSAVTENGIIAPADGKIVVIEKVIEPEYFKDERIQISVFMSPLNVHQNIYPTSGKVVYTKYHKGDYLVAWHPKSSTQNERSTVVIKRRDGTEILVRQIAGAVARRICTYAKVDDSAIGGEEFGFIKFGSRVDIFLPTHAKILCEIDQKSLNKITLLAEL